MSFEYENLENLNIQLIDGDRGKNYPKQSEFQEAGYCLFLSAKNVTKSGFQFSEKVYISEERHNFLRAGKIERYDIVLTTRGTVGNVAFYDNSVLDDVVRVNSGMLILRADKTVWNPRFLYFLFTSKIIQEQISSLTSGSAVPQLPAKDLRKFLLPKVPMDVQNYIVKIIGDISDKLKINHQTNQTLEEMAQAIFKSWFVDFDPVNAKMNGEQPEGMDEATAALFPDQFVESELGLIPEGWMVGTVGSVTSAKGGYAFKSKQFVDEGNPVIKIKNITSTGTVTTSDCQCVDDHIAKTASRFKLSDGDLLMAMTGATVGKSGIYVSDGRDGYLNQRVARFESKVDKSQPCWFTYNVVNRDSIFEQIVGAAQGSAQPNISSNGIEQVKTVVPTFDLIHKYQEVVSPLYAKWISNFRENSHLSELRDTLLPKLLSGEINLD